MTLVRIPAVLAMGAAIYFGLGLEAVSGGRTLWPHIPAMMVILAAWSMRRTPAVVIGAVVGLGCDAIGTGLLGPGMIAGVMAASLSSLARDRWDLESPMAASLFGIAVAAVLLAGPVVAMALSTGTPVPLLTVKLQTARAISSALGAAALLLAARIASRLLKAMTRVLLNA